MDKWTSAKGARVVYLRDSGVEEWVHIVSARFNGVMSS
jgi:hypothetical protein